jgi:nucleoredoxin
MDNQSIEQVIGKKYLRKKSIFGEKEKETLFNNEECNVDEFAGCKYVLLFFSAGWCPPCEQFLQVLKDFYNEVNIDQKQIEVLYISSDRTEDDFKESYKRMPWLTVPFANPMHKNLIKKYDIVGVPIIFVLDAQTGFIITKKGRKDICDLGVGCIKAW